MKKHFFKTSWLILKKTINGFSEDKVTRMSAALAYYTVFSMGPMLLVIISLCSIFYGREAVEGSIYGQIRGFVGANAAREIQSIIRNAAVSNDFSWATIIGIIALLFGATGVFAQIQDSINFIWRLKAKPRKGLIRMAVNRLLSFSMVVSLGFILLVSLILSAAMDLMTQQLTRFLPDFTVYFTYILNILLSFVIITLLFAIIFKVLPDARIGWKDVITGAIVTAVLFMLGKFAISFYLHNSKVGTTYGAAGSLVIVLLWVYYSAIILYFGAEFTKVYTQGYGGHIEPNNYAVWMQTVEMESDASSLQEHAREEEELKTQAKDKTSATKVMHKVIEENKGKNRPPGTVG